MESSADSENPNKACTASEDSTTEESTDNQNINRFPPEGGSNKFGLWSVKFKKGHILYSKCQNKNVCDDSSSEKCIFCFYSMELGLPHLPDMVFANNHLNLEHDKGCIITFNAMDALRRVSNGKLLLKVACSDEWKESREEAKSLNEFKPFDWTFTTDYRGTLSGNFNIVKTTEEIPLNKLKQKEKILFYEDIALFEDELHDNGIAVCSVKMRVMPSCLFILLRYFLRVDNVLIKLNDTRYYHDFETDYVLREYTSREAKIPDLGVPTAMLQDANEVAPMLPVIFKECEKITVPEE